MNNCDILFLQETHSTEKIEHIWRNEWFGTVIYSVRNCYISKLYSPEESFQVS